MFERYTEKARRCIFFARYEASQVGTGEISTESLLLGIAQADRAVFARLGTNIDWMAVRAKLAPSQGSTTDTSRDLPLSHACQQVLAYAAEEFQRLQHPCIECRHLLLGLIQESGSVAAQFLREQNIDRERVLADFQLLPAEIHAGEPGTRGNMPDELRKRIEEMRSKGMASMRPGFVGGFGGGGSGSLDEWGRTNGRASSSRYEDSWRVNETHAFHSGHEITTIERTRLSEDGKTLTYSIDITGPNGETHRHAMDFPLGEPPQPK